MDDLISKSALLAFGGARTIKDAVGNWDELDNKAKAAVLRYALKLKKVILDSPAVDAVPLEPALWTGFGYFKCSNCGGEAPDDGWWRSPFCPHCGKPMENAKGEE